VRVIKKKYIDDFCSKRSFAIISLGYI